MRKTGQVAKKEDISWIDCRPECKISPWAAQIHSLAQAAGFRSVEKLTQGPTGILNLVDSVAFASDSTQASPPLGLCAHSAALEPKVV